MQARAATAETYTPTLLTALAALAAGALWAVVLSGDLLFERGLSVPGSMAAGLLLAASYPAWDLSRFRHASALVFPSLLLAVSFSELLAIHHDVESASGVDWQAFYLSGLVVGLAVGTRAVGGRTGDVVVDRLCSTALVGWMLAFALEAAQWSIGEGAPAHERLGSVKDVVEVGAAAALFVGLSLLGRRRPVA